MMNVEGFNTKSLNIGSVYYTGVGEQETKSIHVENTLHGWAFCGRPPPKSQQFNDTKTTDNSVFRINTAKESLRLVF